MACGSVAVSKSTISPILFDASTLKSILAKMLGVETNQIRDYKSSYSDYIEAETGSNGLIYTINQETVNGQIKTDLLVYGSGQNQETVQKEIDRLQPILARQLVIAQQSTVLKRLAQLGKLSQIKQKDNGVTARLEIEI